MFLKMDTSKLLIPGPVIKVLDRVPSVPTVGIWNTLVRKAWLKVCSLLDKTGLPVTTMRGETLGVPLRSVAETRVYPTPRGAPVEKLAAVEGSAAGGVGLHDICHLHRLGPS